MNKSEWIEKEVAAKEAKMRLDAHNRNVLRSMLDKEHDFWEAQAVREDSYTDPVEGYYEERSLED
jgi:hypothetical protein